MVPASGIGHKNGTGRTITSEGTFPDYRALTKPKELLEEGRNAFVAVTRSKRLIYLSYPRQKVMPWGGIKAQSPSRYLRQAGLI